MLIISCENLVFSQEIEPFKIPLNENIFSKTSSNVKNNNSQDFQNKTIRVLISNKGSFEQKEIILTSTEEIFITSSNQLVANSTTPITITKDGDYFLVKFQGIIKKVLVNEDLIVSTKSAPIEIENIKKIGASAKYLGKIEISSAKTNKMKIINIIDIEDYIKGVVPNEMPIYFGLEALKAQAISARGYAYRDTSLKNTDYDVCDTTGSQVYNGYNSYDTIANKAVNETMGQFALYKGNIILSLYSSTAGGHTENYENVFSQNGIKTKFPSEPIPYLKGTADFDYGEDLSKEDNARRFYETKPESYDINSPRYRWEYIWKIEELEDILAKNLIKFSNNEFVKPSLKNREDFGKIQNIDIPKRGVSGKAMYVRITTDKGVFLIAKEIMIRKIFEYNNKWLPSANIVFTKIFDQNILSGFKVTGGGYGHGVGLSQYGAAGMDKKGFSYDKILKHYYNGISIGSYPVECNFKEFKNCQSTFYSPTAKAYLIIEYSAKPHDLTFKINDSVVLISSQNFDKKYGQIELKKWMKKGINKVELVNYETNMLDFSNHNVKFYVELFGHDQK